MLELTRSTLPMVGMVRKSASALACFRITVALLIANLPVVDWTLLARAIRTHPANFTVTPPAVSTLTGMVFTSGDIMLRHWSSLVHALTVATTHDVVS